MDAKELVTLNEMESGDPNRGLDKIHMETEGDDRRDLSVTVPGRKGKVVQ